MTKLLILFLSLNLAACSILSDKQPVNTRLLVKYATFKVINGKTERAVKAVQWINEAKNYISIDDTVKISLLKSELYERIDWEKFEPEERLVVDHIISQIETELIKDFGSGILSKDQEVRLLEVLNWIEVTASELAKT